ncbi:Haloalkane dehalogenase [Streptomyces microflavus]
MTVPDSSESPCGFGEPAGFGRPGGLLDEPGRPPLLGRRPFRFHGSGRRRRTCTARRPRTHRDVAANGARFHIAEMGEGPLVLLLHGFPQFWWTWRHQLPALAEAGFRAVAMDLRGVGGSDRTPRGYDPANLALDVTGVIRSLGEPDAALVGHDLGGYLAWTAAVMRPKLVRRLAVSSMPHPRRWRSSMLSDFAQSRAGSYIWGFQRPWLPERQLVADDAALVGQAGPGLGRAPDPGLPRRGDPGRLPAGHEHPLDGALLDPAVAARSVRWLVRTGSSSTGLCPRACPPCICTDRSIRRYLEFGGVGRVRRGALPVATFRRCRSLPPRGGSDRLLHRTHQLAQGS